MRYLVVFFLGITFCFTAYCSEIDELTKNAKQGDVDAQFELGLMYDFGSEGVAQNYRIAFRWYKAAAEHGEVGAQVAIGTMFTVGKGVKQDFSEAFKWFNKAARQGNGNAQIGLGTLYAEGLGIEQDYAKSYAWHKLAAKQGDEDAVNNMRKVAKKMSVSQIEHANKLSEEISSTIN